jgi:hypothetical protein
MFYPDGTVCSAGGGCTNWSGAVESVCPECYLGGVRELIRAGIAGLSAGTRSRDVRLVQA